MRSGANVAFPVSVLFMPLLLISCGSHQNTPTQVAARVNKTEITIHQVNAALNQIPGNTSDSALTVSQAVLERLIDQELLVERAREGKLDRSPEVVQAMEMARRTVLANAWMQRVAADAPRPTEQEVKAYYLEHPLYFSGRRIFTWRSVVVHAPADEVQNIEKQFSESEDIDKVMAYLQTTKLVFVANGYTKPTEQIPADLLARIENLKNQEAIALPYAGGVDFIQLMNSWPEPIEETQAWPFIEGFLLQQKQTDRMKSEISGLRASARIEYEGEFKRN
jgi:EpsD family peptidyl-prolyl cis-trans isomerase